MLHSQCRFSGKSSNEDDNSSYFSCVGDLHMSRGLFDQDDLDRFPQHTCLQCK